MGCSTKSQIVSRESTVKFSYPTEVFSEENLGLNLTTRNVTLQNPPKVTISHAVLFAVYVLMCFVCSLCFNGKALRYICDLN